MFFRRKPQTTAQPEWIIAGLGNPGGEYKGTRHNVGFEVIDLLASRNRIRLDKGKHRAIIGTGEIGGAPVMLVKPLTYVNLSGQAVGPLMRSAGLSPEKVIVVADELDIPVGKVKMKQKGSSGGHNGHKSLISAIGQDYPRIKIGIGHGNGAHTIDHVLSGFERDERPIIESMEQIAAEACELICAQGLNAGLNFIASSTKREQRKEDGRKPKTESQEGKG